MLAFSIDYYGIFFRATQSVKLFCTYYLLTISRLSAMEKRRKPGFFMILFRSFFFRRKNYWKFTRLQAKSPANAGFSIFFYSSSAPKFVQGRFFRKFTIKPAFLQQQNAGFSLFFQYFQGILNPYDSLELHFIMEVHI